jgi:putative ABC transport system permease protein
MFARLLWNLLRASRARLAVALVALISGAAVISALVNLDLDVERKLTQEFRTLGANIVVAPAYALASSGASPMSPPLMDESVVQTIEAMRTPAVIAVAPYLYVVARASVENSDLPVVVAGTWLDGIRRLEPAWKVTPGWIGSREERNLCLVGRNVARQLGLAPGKEIELRYAGNSIVETVAAVLEAGGPEDNHIFVNLPEAQGLLGSDKRIGLIQLSVEGSANQIESFANRLGQALPSLEVRPIRQIADAEGLLLDRIRLLIFTMVLLILVLTALCVLATMAALAMERREDVGLMKALGGSISRIVGLFLAEVGVLGAAGGLLGYLAGIALSRWIGERVFGAAITPRLDVLPLTVALTVGVALAGAMPLRLLGKVRPAVILRGD